MWYVIVRVSAVVGVAACIWPSYIKAEGVTLSRSEKSVLANGAENVLRVAYDRAGIALNVVQLPRQRSLVAAQTGATDGEVIRGPVVIGRLTDFRQIEPAIAYNEIAMFRRIGSQITKSDLDNLESFSVGYLNGIKPHAVLASRAGQAVHVETPDQLLKMLDAGRVDLAIINPIGARVWFAAGDYANVDPTGIVMKSEPLHHYLHVDLSEFADQIEAALAEMATAGEIEAAFKEGVQRFQ